MKNWQKGEFSTGRVCYLQATLSSFTCKPRNKGSSKTEDCGYLTLHSVGEFSKVRVFLDARESG